MFSIEVSNNINKVIQTIDAKKDKVELAVVRALNKTALWVKAQASREISTEKQIKLKLIRNRLQVIKANRNSLKALVRASLYGIKAAKLGSMRQTKTGATVGKYMFHSAFVATMPRGYTSVFKRKGKTALPIQDYH